MKLRVVLLNVVLALACALSVQAQQPQTGKDVHVAPNAPKDQPVDVASEEAAKKFEESLKPHIQKAKETYPAARKRFLDGLPPKHSFFVTTKLRDAEGRFEQVFIAVEHIEKGVIKGLIWNEINLVSGYKFRDSYSFPESELLDWTISKPDGTEDGNYIGKFIDSLRSN